MAVKIDLISGFLGAGKSTLILKLLKEAFHEQCVAVIENEFGQIAIDGSLLRDYSIPVREISAGCICCSLQRDFRRTLSELLAQHRFDRIIIEPSGVGKLSDILRECASPSVRREAEPGMIAAVADALRAELYLKNFGEFYRDQIGYANAVLLSRTEQLPPERLEKIRTLLHNLNPRAAILTTPWDSLSGPEIVAAAEGTENLAAMLDSLACDPYAEANADFDSHCHCHDGHDHDAHEIFETWGIETAFRYSEQELREILSTLAGSAAGEIVRSKGFVASDGGAWLRFDAVPGESRLCPCRPCPTGRICVIGRHLNREELSRLFRADIMG